MVIHTHLPIRKFWIDVDGSMRKRQLKMTIYDKALNGILVRQVCLNQLLFVYIRILWLSHFLFHLSREAIKSSFFIHDLKIKWDKWLTMHRCTYVLYVQLYNVYTLCKLVFYAEYFLWFFFFFLHFTRASLTSTY